MFNSLKLGKLFGIDLYLHGTFWLLPLFVLFSNFGHGIGTIAFELLFVFAVFACIALHEVGHALAAAAYGIRTRDITLYPIGGVAALERMPEKPWQEVVVALAGPAVNVIIALGLLAGLVLGDMAFVSPLGHTADVVEAFVSQVILANAFLCVFNLLPAFPMDGGRVLRALLATRLTRLRATEVAVQVGTVVAIGLFIAGVAWVSLNLILIAVVVWLLSQAELKATRYMDDRRRYGDRYGEEYEAPRRRSEPAPETATAAEPTADEVAADLAARRFSGLAWDSARRVWVQWVNGVPVRVIP